MIKKKSLVLTLVFVLAFSLFACGKNEEEVKNEEPTEVIENTEQPSENTTQVENTEVGGWNVVNLPYEQAPEEVKSVFKSAMESDAVKATNEMFAPVTYIGSQIVSGTNYGFVAKDANGADRYIYIYQNANQAIEKVEISKPNEKLEILPEVSENVATTEQTTDSQSETTTQNTDTQSQNTQSSESTTANSSNTTNSTNANNNANSTNSSNSTSNTATEEKPKNIEEGIKKNSGQTVEAYVSQLNPGDTMKCELKENTLSYSYTFPEEIAESHLPVYKEEITTTIKDNLKIYTNTAAALESDSGVEGAIIKINYFTKDGKELVTFKINKNGLVE